MWIHGADLVWFYFDIAASFIWAISGALVAAERGYDLTGICAIALVSSTGGGLLRDGIFLQQGPPEMLRTPAYIALAASAGLIVWTAGSRARIIGVLRRVSGFVDAIGLGAFAVVGMQLAQKAGIRVPGVVLVGLVNAVGGSVLRSLLIHEIPEVFQPGELTALASLIGCIFYLICTQLLAVDPKVAALVTIVVVGLVRGGSVRYGLRTQPARGFPRVPQRSLPTTSTTDDRSSVERSGIADLTSQSTTVIVSPRRLGPPR